LGFGKFFKIWLEVCHYKNDKSQANGGQDHQSHPAKDKHSHYIFIPVGMY
jgi:hypothetical protein